MKTLKIAICIISVAVMSFGLAGCSRSGPPEKIIKADCEELRELVGIKYEFVSAERGTVLESEGKYGPKGTKAYPVRVHYKFISLHDGRTSDSISELIYYKNEYGEWMRARK